MGLAKQEGLHAIPTGIDHGTVTVIAENESFEITTYRRDVATDGRRAVVAFTDTLVEDALRRDFTMNALYADANGYVTDPLGGLPDLHARRLRFVQDANQRIKEDYLRSLRYFRFHAWYGDQEAGLDADALAAIAANLDGIETISKERVGSELRKLLSAPRPETALAAMAQTGVLMRILPGAEPALLQLLVHFEDGIQPSPDLICRLAALGGESPVDYLRLSKFEAKGLRVLKDYMVSTESSAELGYRLGKDAARSVLLLRATLSQRPVDQFELFEIERGSAAEFPVSASDLPNLLVGREIGRELRRLESRWVDSGLVLSKSDLLE
jgi:tRNA nucleotidyltransferase/poly(A) polymerase